MATRVGSNRDGTSSSNREVGDSRGDWCLEVGKGYEVEDRGEGESSESGKGSPGKGTVRHGKRHVQEWCSLDQPREDGKRPRIKDAWSLVGEKK